MSAAIPFTDSDRQTLILLERDMVLVKNAQENQLASREWVKELVAPIVENTRETRHAVEMQRRDMEIFIAAHNKAMEERAKQDKAEHDAKMAALQAQTWSALLKDKWGPILAFCVAIAVILNHLGTFAMSWMSAHGVPVK